MLGNRRVHSTLYGETIKVSVAKGCPQRQTLDWDLVIDSLLVKLNSQGFYTQGYADDLVTLLTKNYFTSVSELMHQALKMVKSWCTNMN